MAEEDAESANLLSSGGDASDGASVGGGSVGPQLLSPGGTLRTILSGVSFEGQSDGEKSDLDSSSGGRSLTPPEIRARVLARKKKAAAQASNADSNADSNAEAEGGVAEEKAKAEEAREGVAREAAEVPAEEAGEGAVEESRAGALLDLDPLQIIGKPNGWKYPDPQLNLKPAPEESTARRLSVCAVSVQLTSQSFSFQILSARCGWGLRIFPRDAAPSMLGVDASPHGVLGCDDPDQVVVAAENGNVGKAGHRHNFHVVEGIGDLVTIFVGRSLLDEGGAESLSPHDQINQVWYQVWYRVAQRAVPVLPEVFASPTKPSPEQQAQQAQQAQQGGGLPGSPPPGSPIPPASPVAPASPASSRWSGRKSGRKSGKPTFQDFAQFECDFAGGDGFDLTDRRYSYVSAKLQASPRPSANQAAAPGTGSAAKPRRRTIT